MIEIRTELHCVLDIYLKNQHDFLIEFVFKSQRKFNRECALRVNLTPVKNAALNRQLIERLINKRRPGMFKLNHLIKKLIKTKYFTASKICFVKSFKNTSEQPIFQF